MEAYVLNGGRRLAGEVNVAGSKNTALAILSAVVLADGTTTLHNVPDVSDTRTKAELLKTFGAKVEWRGKTLIIDSSRLHNGEADEQMVRSIRTSFYLLGPLVARIGYVNLPAPGGCKIGARPVDFHVRGLEALGAKIQLENGIYTLEAQKLVGTDVYLDFPSAGATQHLMSAATLAQGCTTIHNAAMEPEVVVLADFLNRMGAKVEGAGTSIITIEGVAALSGCEFNVPSDRLQAGTYLIAGAITCGDVTVRNVLPEHQLPLTSKLREMGCEISEGHDWVRTVCSERLKATRIKTMPYPGFPTDVQQPMAALMALADGVSVIDETIYESRIGHVQELNRMGAKIVQKGQTSIIEGVDKLSGSDVWASDLRAGAALVLAGLAAEGETVVRNIHFIDRGYERLENVLSDLGAIISRIELDEKILA